MPRISVIVPVYKVEDCLAFCVDSILAQSFTDFELILVDDGSPDSCGAICDAYAEKDSRVRVIHKPNGGLSDARNAGMDIMRGEYVTFIDSDDAVTVDYLQVLYDAVQKNGADIAVCRFEEFEDGTIPTLSRINADYAEDVLLTGKDACMDVYAGNLPINACAKLIRTERIGEDRFPVGRLHEDQAFIPPVLYRAETVADIRENLYLYRVRSESITRTKFSLRRYDDIWAIDNCIRFFEDNNEPEIVAAAKSKRQKLLCVYSIYARRDGVEIPEEYNIGTAKALKYLYGKVSDSKFEYYLAQVNPKYVRPYEYLVRAKKMLGGRGRKHE